jgi:hypothetical protein
LQIAFSCLEVLKDLKKTQFTLKNCEGKIHQTDFFCLLSEENVLQGWLISRIEFQYGAMVVGVTSFRLF